MSLDALQPDATPPANSGTSLVSLDLKEKEIVFVLPLESSCINGTLNLPGGAYIQGNFSGTLICARGAIIIAKGASFSGFAEADEIYIAGEVGRKNGNKGSSLLGRHLIAVSEDAVIHADLTSRVFSMNTKNIFGSVQTLV